MLARDCDMGVTPLQGLDDLWGPFTRAFVRRTHSSPGYHISGLRPWENGGPVARECEFTRAFVRRTHSNPGYHISGLRPWENGGPVAREREFTRAFVRRTHSSPGYHISGLTPGPMAGLQAPA